MGTGDETIGWPRFQALKRTEFYTWPGNEATLGEAYVLTTMYMIKHLLVHELILCPLTGHLTSSALRLWVRGQWRKRYGSNMSIVLLLCPTRSCTAYFNSGIAAVLFVSLIQEVE